MPEAPELEFVDRLRTNVNSIYTFINKSTLEKYRKEPQITADDHNIRLMNMFFNFLKDTVVQDVNRDRGNKMGQSAATSYHTITEEPQIQLSIPSHMQKYVINVNSGVKSLRNNKLFSSRGNIFYSGLNEEQGYFRQVNSYTLGKEEGEKAVTDLKKKEKGQVEKKMINQNDQLHYNYPCSRINVIRCSTERQKKMQQSGDTNKVSNKKLPNNISCDSNETDYLDTVCTQRLSELSKTRLEIQNQIRILKMSDRRCSIAEKTYKKDIIDSLERQQTLLIHLQDVEISASKWRKNKVYLKSQLSDITKRQQELTKKINIKTEEMKSMHKEIEDFQNRINLSEKGAIDIVSTHGNNKIKPNEPRKRWGEAITSIGNLENPKDSHSSSIQNQNESEDLVDSKAESTTGFSSSQDGYVKFLYSDEVELSSLIDDPSVCETSSNIFEFTNNNVGAEVMPRIRSSLCKSPSFTKKMRASQCFLGPEILQMPTVH